jgi:5-methyltetrahydrofolate--homocysteine methyltransferase
MIASDFTSLLSSKKTFVSDGATGTNLQDQGLPSGMAPEKWLMERPEEIAALQQKFIQNGSDIILTCTFGGNRIRLEHAGLAGQLELINQKAVALSKKVAQGKDVLVGGSMGPTGEMMGPFGKLDEDSAFDIYLQQAKSLVGAGIDLLVIETQFDLSEAQAAVRAIRSFSDIALICSFSFDRGKRTMMGVKPQQVVEAFANSHIQAIGVNCGKSLEANFEVLKELKSMTDLPIWFKPNAGAPETDGQGSIHYHITPAEMGEQAKLWVENGAKIVGGCCGTSPEHLRAIAAAVKEA